MVRIYNASVLRLCGATGFEFERLMTPCTKCPPTPMEIPNDSNNVVFARFRRELAILPASSLLLKRKSGVRENWPHETEGSDLQAPSLLKSKTL